MANHDPQAMTAEQRYESLVSERKPYEMRAREASELTIPHVFPPEGTQGGSALPTPFQSVGARGVNNLVAKLLLALFPPGGSFFRLDVDEFVLEELKAKAGGEDPRAEFEEALSKVERAVVKRLDQSGGRTSLSQALRHLVVTGNALLFVGKNAKLKMHRLDEYVVKRDGEGLPLEIVVREKFALLSLPEAAREIVESTPEYMRGQDKSGRDDIFVYTRVSRQETGSWTVHQEVTGQEIEGTRGTYPKDNPAFLPLRWNAIDGEDYGRGHCEDYLGDLQTAESGNEAIVRFGAAASKILVMVNESGVTSKRVLEESPSGAIIDGDARDVSIFQMEKFADFQVVKATTDQAEKRLEHAFLLNSSVQRQAERVTAEEIRFMAGELEQSLGGTYSTLATELQRPLVVRVMAQMTKDKKLPPLPKDTVEPKIITGLDGLGRSADLMKLDILLQGVSQVFGPDAVAEYSSAGAYIKRRATALGIDIDGFVRSEEDVQAVRQQKAQQAMAEKLGPAGIKAASDQATSVREQDGDTQGG